MSSSAAARGIDRELFPGRPPNHSEIGGGRKHVSVIGPHLPLPSLLRRHQVHRVGRTYKKIGRSGNHPRTGPPQQRLVDGNQVPQSVLHVLGKERGELARVIPRQHAFPHTSMNYSVQLRKSPERGIDGIRLPDQFADPGRLRLMEVKLCDIRGVEVHVGLTITILFDDFRAVPGLRHSSPDFPHRVEDPRFLARRDPGRSGNRTQLRHRFPAAFDHDNAAFLSLAYQFRGVNVELPDRRLPHVLHCSTTAPTSPHPL
jgi:hypothetical protein